MRGVKLKPQRLDRTYSVGLLRFLLGSVFFYYSLFTKFYWRYAVFLQVGLGHSPDSQLNLYQVSTSFYQQSRRNKKIATIRLAFLTIRVVYNTWRNLCLVCCILVDVHSWNACYEWAEPHENGHLHHNQRETCNHQLVLFVVIVLVTASQRPRVLFFPVPHRVWSVLCAFVVFLYGRLLVSSSFWSNSNKLGLSWTNPSSVLFLYGLLLHSRPLLIFGYSFLSHFR